MKKRLIAAVVLVSLALMNVPVALAFPLQAGPSTTAKPVEPAASLGHDHSYCRRVHAKFVPMLFVTPAPAGMPCSDQHPCCAKPGPEDPPALPAASKSVRSSSEAAPVTVADGHRDGRIRTAATTMSGDAFQPYSTRSTVLRI